MEASNPAMSGGVGLRRYFKTNAATPFFASAFATFHPSFSIERVRKPPPGATMTAAPVAVDLDGRNGVSVAMLTFRANILPYWECHASSAVASGSLPVLSTIAFGCLGVAIGVILSFCAVA